MSNIITNVTGCVTWCEKTFHIESSDFQFISMFHHPCNSINSGVSSDNMKTRNLGDQFLVSPSMVPMVMCGQTVVRFTFSSATAFITESG